MENYKILVNKEHKLPFYYIPNNLITVENEKIVLKVYKEYLKLQKISKNNDLNIFIDSGYRSYEHQIKVYLYYLMKLGLKETKKRVAIPGCSEHQTGLAFDIGILEDNKERNITIEESKFLEEIGYKYGFILRYPKGKEYITGFNYEPWHFRYIGDVKVSEYLYYNNLTLEEYYEKNKVK